MTTTTSQPREVGRCLTEEEAGTESQGGHPNLLAQLPTVEAKIET